ncbi:MAG: GNAT family N-acetyltransferase [Ilumatobacteraceae bacterium]
MKIDLPAPFVARPYRGAGDHAAMAAILTEYRQYAGNPEMASAEQFDVTYANLSNCDPANDIVIIETTDGEAAGYVRVSWNELKDGSRDYVLFGPVRPAHLTEPLYRAMATAQEAHLRPMAAGVADARFRAYSPHPGPGQAATGEAAWLEALGYQPIRFEASLVRPDLEDIADLALPEGVEVRAVTAEMLRPIFAAHHEAFRNDWDFTEATEEDFHRWIDDPLRDESLWKIAWAGDTVVGQVKSFINAEENAELGYLRGYTEYISTHADWRNKGIAGSLLASSLRELKARGMTEAALGADTENPGGAFQLYTRMGFQLRSYEATYAKPMS